jgi:hypothetical protein
MSFMDFPNGVILKQSRWETSITQHRVSKHFELEMVQIKAHVFGFYYGFL